MLSAVLAYNQCMAMHRTSAEVANIIRQFLDGTGEKWDWDDFISIPISDSRLDEIRKTCGELPERFPPRESGWYCSENGMKVLREVAADLTSRSSL